MGFVINVAIYKVGKDKGGGGNQIGGILIYIMIIYFLDPRICWVRERKNTIW